MQSYQLSDKSNLIYRGQELKLKHFLQRNFRVQFVDDVMDLVGDSFGVRRTDVSDEVAPVIIQDLVNCVTCEINNRQVYYIGKECKDNNNSGSRLSRVKGCPPTTEFSNHSECGDLFPPYYSQRFFCRTCSLHNMAIRYLRSILSRTKNRSTYAVILTRKDSRQTLPASTLH